MLKLVIEGNTLSELRANLREVSAGLGLGNGSQIVPEHGQNDESDAPQAETTKKRGRPAKTDAPAAEEKKPEEKAPEPEKPALTEKDCREAAQNALKAGAAEDVVRGLFGKFGANRVSELKPEIYADFIAACGVEAEKAKSSAALMD